METIYSLSNYCDLLYIFLLVFFWAFVSGCMSYHNSSIFKKNTIMLPQMDEGNVPVMNGIRSVRYSSLAHENEGRRIPNNSMLLLPSSQLPMLEDSGG